MQTIVNLILNENYGFAISTTFPEVEHFKMEEVNYGHTPSDSLSFT